MSDGLRELAAREAADCHRSSRIEALKGVELSVLDHGFVRLIDYMGDDGAIVQAARVSYGAGTRSRRDDRGLIRYLMRHRHSSPFEMCLSGDTQIPTFTAGGVAVRHYTIRDLARAFEEGGRANSWAKLVRIRTVNPETGVVTGTRIRRAWRTGVRPTYEVAVAPFQRKITVTDNHPFLCDDGQYRTLGELGVGSRVALNGIPATSEEIRDEVLRQRRQGASISVISESTGIATSTVWKISNKAGLGGRVSRRTGFLKKPVGEHRDPRAIARRRVPKGPCSVCADPNGRDIHHLDENPHNNEPSNLLRLCPKHYRHIHTRSTLERVFFAEITSVTFKGEQEVFDLEVKSDNHNFVADGFVVHNCEVKLHIKAPIFVARQWMRHRTACLSGDTELHFDLPGGIDRRGNQLYKLSVKDVFDRFQPTENTQRPDKQGYPFHKRDRVQSMLLRSVNEETGEVYHTNVVDVWESGEKEVFHVKLEDGTWFECSKDHRIFTEDGWRKLEELDKGDHVITIGPGRGTGVVPHVRNADEGLEAWKPVPGWEMYYEVSDHGRVRRIAGGRGSRRGIKKNTISNGRAVVSLNRPGVQETALVHRLVMEAFIGPCPDGMECCHNDGNSLNNWLVNLRWDTKQANAVDRVRDGATTALSSRGVPIVSITSKGTEMTYDLEVAGPWHNFSAGGAIVHNSVNEVSGRYSVLSEEVYVPPPERMERQSSTNAQGSGGSLPELEAGRAHAMLSGHTRASVDVYSDLIETGLTRELARGVLTVNHYTEWYWKIDLHNLLHFLSLRADGHAQYEIRAYADVIADLVRKWVPLTWEAFVDYRLSAKTFSGPEMGVLRGLVRSCLEQSSDKIGGNFDALVAEAGLSGREVKALRHSLGIPSEE